MLFELKLLGDKFSCLKIFVVLNGIVCIYNGISMSTAKTLPERIIIVAFSSTQPSSVITHYLYLFFKICFLLVLFRLIISSGRDRLWDWTNKYINNSKNGHKNKGGPILNYHINVALTFHGSFGINN